MIDFTGRKHFFTDWAVISPRNAQDVTQDISPYTITVNKKQNNRWRRRTINEIREVNAGR
ncbi:DUF1460 domain-containing protein [Klebsiella pneumoniae]|nr:DUF1460 domain-containing protein [Klebsiella pneumoniae]